MKERSMAFVYLGGDFLVGSVVVTPAHHIH